MRIELDLPDWVDERNIHIFAGIEEVARKHKDAPWEIKISRCSMCGRCCRKLPRSFPFRKRSILFWRKTRICKYLVKEVGRNKRWLCGLRGQRPLGCGVGQPFTIPECTLKYEECE